MSGIFPILLCQPDILVRSLKTVCVPCSRNAQGIESCVSGRKIMVQCVLSRFVVVVLILFEQGANL